MATLTREPLGLSRPELLRPVIDPDKKPDQEGPSFTDRLIDGIRIPRLRYTPTSRQLALVSLALAGVLFGISRINPNPEVNTRTSGEIAIKTRLQELCEESKGPGNISPHDGESPRTPKGYASLEAPYAYGGMSMSVPYEITQKLGLPGDMVLTCEGWTVRNAELVASIFRPPYFPEKSAWGSGDIGHFRTSR